MNKRYAVVTNTLEQFHNFIRHEFGNPYISHNKRESLVGYDTYECINHINQIRGKVFNDYFIVDPTLLTDKHFNEICSYLQMSKILNKKPLTVLEQEIRDLETMGYRE